MFCCTKVHVTHQSFCEILKRLLGMFNFFRWSFDTNNVSLLGEGDSHTRQVSGDVLDVLSLATNNEPVQPRGSHDLFSDHAVGLV